MSIAIYNRPSDNVAGSIAWSAIASGDSAYPAANLWPLTDLDRGNPAKLTIKTAGGWHGDAGSAISVPLMVAWHNGDAAQTIKFEAHSASLSNPATVADVTTTLTLPAKRLNGFTLKQFKDMTGLTGYGAKRYYRFYFPVPGSNNSQNWGLKIWMGSTIRTLDNFDFGHQTHQGAQQQYIGMATPFAYSWRYNLQSAARTLAGPIATTSAGWAEFIDWYESAGGPVDPILLIPDITVNDAWIARFGIGGANGVATDVLDVTRNTKEFNTLTGTFEEATAGGPEWT